jgi:hypothetical protein
LYANVADRSDDPRLLTEVLAGFRRLLPEGVHGNALGMALPCIDGKLGGRRVVEMIFAASRSITDGDTLDVLMKAAVRVPSFTQQDRAEMLNQLDPRFTRARGSLLVKSAPR